MEAFAVSSRRAVCRSTAGGILGTARRCLIFAVVERASLSSRLIVSRCACEAISRSRPVLLPAALGMSIVVHTVHAWVRASPFPTALRDQGRDVVVMCLAVGVPFLFPLRCGTGHSEAERGSTAGRNSAVRRGRSFELARRGCGSRAGGGSLSRVLGCGDRAHLKATCEVGPRRTRASQPGLRQIGSLRVAMSSVAFPCREGPHRSRGGCQRFPCGGVFVF